MEKNVEKNCLRLNCKSSLKKIYDHQQALRKISRLPFILLYITA